MIPQPTFADYDKALARDPNAPDDEDEFIDDFAGLGMF